MDSVIEWDIFQSYMLQWTDLLYTTSRQDDYAAAFDGNESFQDTLFP